MCETRLSLLARVRNLGDGRSWDEFHAIYRPLIFGYLRSMGLNEDDAQELTQEVFCRLMRILPTFELDRRRCAVPHVLVEAHLQYARPPGAAAEGPGPGGGGMGAAVQRGR